MMLCNTGTCSQQPAHSRHGTECIKTESRTLSLQHVTPLTPLCCCLCPAAAMIVLCAASKPSLCCVRSCKQPHTYGPKFLPACTNAVAQEPNPCIANSWCRAMTLLRTAPATAATPAAPAAAPAAWLAVLEGVNPAAALLSCVVTAAPPVTAVGAAAVVLSFRLPAGFFQSSAQASSPDK